MLTVDDVLNSVPKARHSTITTELVDNINILIRREDEDVKEHIVDSFMTYGKVLESGKYTIEQYTRAIKYITFKMMDYDNIDAYEKAYPERYTKHIAKYRAEGYTLDECRSRIGSIVSGVAHSKLVTTIMSQIQIPTKILNLGLLQKAINKEAALMNNARSEMVQHLAAKTLIDYLGSTDEDKIEIPVSVQDKGAIVDQYKEAMSNLADAALQAIKDGADVKAIANAKVIDVEVE